MKLYSHPTRESGSLPQDLSVLGIDPLIARATACELLGGVVPKTLRRYEQRGKLTPHKLSGKRVAYLASEIRKLISESRAAA